MELARALPWVQIVALVAVLVASYYHLSIWSVLRRRKKPFPFLRLPFELRETIYQHISDRDPCYPAPARRRRALLGRLTSRPSRQCAKSGNRILLANRQVHAEFLAVVCRERAFVLTVTEDNVLQRPKIWTLGAAAQRQVRRCDVRIVAPPSILGVLAAATLEAGAAASANPAAPGQPSRTLNDNFSRVMINAAALNAASHGQVQLATRQLREAVGASLADMPALEHTTLHVRALANPLLLWFHGSQEFKSAALDQERPAGEGGRAGGVAGGDANDTTALRKPGLWFEKISLSSDCCTRGENHLARSDTGNWQWRCPLGHFVADGLDGKQSIRGFCAALYSDCAECSVAEDV